MNYLKKEKQILNTLSEDNVAGVSLSSSGAAIQRGGVGGSGLGEGAELMDEGGLLLLRPLLPVQK